MRSTRLKHFSIDMSKATHLGKKMSTCTQSQSVKNRLCPEIKLFCFFLIGIHPMQGWRATTRHGKKNNKSKQESRLERA